MCNILKTVDRSVKWIKMGPSMSDSLSSVWGHSVISDLKIFKRLLLPQFSTNFIQTLQKACDRGDIQVTYFFWQFAKF